MIFDRTGLHHNISCQDIVQVGDERSIVSTDVNHKLHQFKEKTQSILRISVEQLFEITHSNANFIVTIEDRDLRNKAIAYVSKKSWNQISVVMENCSIMPDVSIGHGVVIFPMNVVLSQTIVHDNVSIYPGCAIGHLTTINKNTVIQGGCFVGGSTAIGESCLLGLKSTVSAHINFPSDSKLGAFSSLTKSPDCAGFFVGTPARRMRNDS